MLGRPAPRPALSGRPARPSPFEIASYANYRRISPSERRGSEREAVPHGTALLGGRGVRLSVFVDAARGSVMTSESSPQRSRGQHGSRDGPEQKPVTPWPARMRGGRWECFDLEVPWAGPGSVRSGSVPAFTRQGSGRGQRAAGCTAAPCSTAGTEPLRGDRWPRGHAPVGLATPGSPRCVLLRDTACSPWPPLQARCEPRFEMDKMDSENPFSRSRIRELPEGNGQREAREACPVSWDA